MNSFLHAGKQQTLKLCGLLLMAVQPNKTTIVKVKRVRPCVRERETKEGKVQYATADNYLLEWVKVPLRTEVAHQPKF